jgi:TonB family protein
VSFQTKVRSVRSSLLVFLTIMSLVAALGPIRGFAQDAFDRKVKSKVPPTYPEIARKIGLTGTVKLQVVVAPNGSVKETKVIGGHPILVTAAVDAVKKWKFDTASGESTGTVEFRFEPGN